MFLHILKSKERRKINMKQTITTKEIILDLVEWFEVYPFAKGDFENIYGYSLGDVYSALSSSK